MPPLRTSLPEAARRLSTFPTSLDLARDAPRRGRAEEFINIFGNKGVAALPALIALITACGQQPQAPTTPTPTEYLGDLSDSTFDRAYLSMMSVHHQAAIDNSNAVLAKNPADQIKAWANQVISEQQAEINEMQTWLQDFGGPDAGAQAVMRANLMDVVSKITASANPGRTYLEGMIPHHGGANNMATLALEKSSDARVLDLSRNIVQTQGQEMRDFKAWLLTHP